MTDTRTRLLTAVALEVGAIITQADDPIDAVLASDLNCDSLHRISLLMALEEEFGIDIHDDEDAVMGPDATLRDMLELVERKLAEKVGEAVHG